MTQEELIEQLADKEHASWARWMEYLFSKCDDWYEVDVNGQEIYSGKIIPLDLVERWQRQIEVPYAELSEREKQSDRDEVDHILPIINKHVNDKLTNAVVKTISHGGIMNPLRKPLQREGGY